MHGKPIRASGSKSRSLRCVPLLSYVRDRHGTLFKNMDRKTLDALTTLDLHPGTTIHEVKKTYRELALIWHPDKVPDQVKDRATRKFTQINGAYRWLVENPETLKSSHRKTSDAHPFTRSYKRPNNSTDASSKKTDSGSSDPVVQRILSAARRWKTDMDEGVYIYPDIDLDKASNFIAQLHGLRVFNDLTLKARDLVIFYDIDGSGEEGMALTRTNHLINNNEMTLFSIDDLVDVRLKDALFFWCEISVRRRGQRSFERVGYAEKESGKMLTDIIYQLIKNSPAS